MGRFEDCELWGNGDSGVLVQDGGKTTLAGCTLRDHSEGSACGVFVCAEAAGGAIIGSGSVFARNVGGDVVVGRAPASSGLPWWPFI